jgi:hypothetical protein
MRVGDAQKYWRYGLCPDDLIRSNQSVDRRETYQMKTLRPSLPFASDLGDVTTDPDFGFTTLARSITAGSMMLPLL